MSFAPFSSACHGRPARFLMAFGVAVAVAVIAPSAWSDEPPPPVVQVEEDWKLVLNQPDEDVVSPQFHTAMSPFGHMDNFFTQVTWNYREAESFSSGGLQLQAWDQESQVRGRNVGSAPLSTAAETITWTQVLSTDGAKVSFSVAGGHSTTWGAFGGDLMKIEADVSVPDLNQYRSDVSTENSWITFGSNRVNLLVLTEVRRYGPNGLLSVDNTPRIVYQRAGQ